MNFILHTQKAWVICPYVKFFKKINRHLVLQSVSLRPLTFLYPTLSYGANVTSHLTWVLWCQS